MRDIARAIDLAARAAAARGERDTTPDAAGCSATVQPSVGVAAGLPTPLDVAARRTSQNQGQLQLGLLQAQTVQLEVLRAREARAQQKTKQHGEVPFQAPFAGRETEFDKRLRKAAGSSDVGQFRTPPPAPRRPVESVARPLAPSARGAEGAQNFPGLPLPAAVQNEIQPDGLSANAAPFWGTLIRGGRGGLPLVCREL
jgi:hypothetical protein